VDIILFNAKYKYQRCERKEKVLFVSQENDTHSYSRSRTFPVNRQKASSHGNVRALRNLAVALVEFVVETVNYQLTAH